jgi:hypothetical protein
MADQGFHNQKTFFLIRPEICLVLQKLFLHLFFNSIYISAQIFIIARIFEQEINFLQLSQNFTVVNAALYQQSKISIFIKIQLTLERTTAIILAFKYGSSCELSEIRMNLFSILQGRQKL